MRNSAAPIRGLLLLACVLLVLVKPVSAQHQGHDPGVAPDMAAGESTMRGPLPVGVIAAAAAVALLVMLAGLLKLTGRHRPKPVLALELALLVAVYGVTAYIVHARRNPAQTTVLAGTMMDMSAIRPVAGAAPVATETLREGTFSAKVTYTATVVALNDEDIYPRVVGRIVSLPVYAGDEVRPGQLLVRLDSRELSAREREAQAGLASASAGQAAAAAKVQQARAGQSRQQASTQVAAAGVTEARRMVNVAHARKTEAEKAFAQTRHNVRAAGNAATGAQARLAAANADVEAAQSGIENAAADLEAAAADLVYWQAEIERMRQLLKGGAASTDEFQMEEAKHKAAAAKVQQAKAMVAERKAGLAAANARVREAQAEVDKSGAEVLAAEAEVEKTAAAVESMAAEAQAAEARLEMARAEVKAAHAELAGNAAEVKASAAEQLAARAMTRQSGAALTVARTVRGYTEIRAATRARVIERVVSPGVLVSPGTLLLRLAQMDRVRLQANVAQDDMAGITVGSPVTVHVLTSSSRPLQAAVTSLAPAADPVSRTSTVEALVPNRNRRLLPGQAVTMAIATAQVARALTVPNHALVTRTGESLGPSSAVRYAVWVVRQAAAAGKTVYTCPMHPEVQSDKPGSCPKCGMALVAQAGGGGEATTVYTCPMHPEVQSDKPGACPKCGMALVAQKSGGKATAHLQAVTLGPSDGKRTQVLSGLRAGDEIIVQGLENLAEGQAVQNVPWSEAGPLELPKPAGQPAGSTNPHAGHGG